MLVSIYVFESVFGNDLVNIIKEFIDNPLKESREMRKHLLRIYRNFMIFVNLNGFL